MSWWAVSSWCRRSVLAIAVVACATACARRTDAETRAAWQRARGGGDTGRARGDGAGGGDEGELPAGPHAEGWAYAAELIARAIDVLRLAGDDVALARLAEDLCEVEPEPRPSPHGEVRVCFPAPPVEVRGRAFTLELGAAGVIGLVSVDLDAKESQAMLADALRMTQRWCNGPRKASTGGGETLQPASDGRPRRGDSAKREEFHTCAVGGGPVLAVGRFPSRAEVDLWQVSVAVLGAN
jgi:hypothetical protein